MVETENTAEELKQLLQSSPERAGIFEDVVGLNMVTTSFKAVHMMNDLAQQAMGGAPAHRGDLLCMVIRPPSVMGEGEESFADSDLRAHSKFSELYGRALPASLGPAKLERLRAALRLLLNNDGGMYLPGTQMASGLGTHWTLLGFEGFSRFGLGRALAEMLGLEGRERVRELFTTAEDPVSRAAAPLLFEAELAERRSGRREHELSEFDRRFGYRIVNLLAHPLSKPTALRALSLAATCWLVLKVLGAGRDDKRPRVLVLPEGWNGRRKGPSLLRQEATMSYSLCVEALDRRVGEALEQDEDFRTGRSGASAGHLAVAALRASKTKLYWPDSFAAALGRLAGFVQPKTDRAGWGRYLCLTGDILETMLLMYTPPSGEALQWNALWGTVGEELGLVVGANPYEDDLLLAEAGMEHLPGDSLFASSEILLDCAVQRGLAKRLPDSEAEVGARFT